jgi:hypothetical protein
VVLSQSLTMRCGSVAVGKNTLTSPNKHPRAGQNLGHPVIGHGVGHQSPSSDCARTWVTTKVATFQYFDRKTSQYSLQRHRSMPCIWERYLGWDAVRE